MNKLIILSLVVFATYPSTASAEVKTMSLESFRQEGSVRFWQVEVKCDDSSKFMMRRVVGQGNPWCSLSDTSSCDDSKFTLSRSLCEAGRPAEVAAVPKASNNSNNIGGSDDKTTPLETTTVTTTDNALKSSNDNVSLRPNAVADGRGLASASELSDPLKESERTELMREQVQIEEQRILIEQKRLELRKAELELNKLKANQ